jgi:hypothetical protein
MARNSIFFFFLLVAGYFPVNLIAQSSAFEGHVLDVHVSDGDTMPFVTLRPHTVLEFKHERSKREQRKWDALMRRVTKVYPYARVAGELMREYDRQLKTLTSERDRKEYLKMAEEELKREFEGEIRDMTIREGYILIKLIDRETGNTSYDLIKELRGGFSAFMWQAVARLFGSNLKMQYDSLGEDAMIEEIVALIEEGELYVAERRPNTPEARARISKKSKRKGS